MILMLTGICLKTLDTIGSCQRLVFLLGVSQHIYKITNLSRFVLNWSSKLRDNNERKNTFATRSCVLPDAWFRDLKSNSEVSKSNSWKITYFSFYVTSKGAVLNYQQLPQTIDCWSVCLFYLIWNCISRVTNVNKRSQIIGLDFCIL